jgi:hypothetical protein
VADGTVDLDPDDRSFRRHVVAVSVGVSERGEERTAADVREICGNCDPDANPVRELLGVRCVPCQSGESGGQCDRP